MKRVGKMGKRVWTIAAGVLWTATAAPGVVGQAGAADRDAPVVVELFSSQACSSCVAASAYITQLAARDDVVALSWHVDYWNTLETRQGRWVDPFSDESYTARQRAYNKNIRRRSTVYTPQIVVNGASQAVGSKRDAVDRLIEAAREKTSDVSIAAGRAGERLAFRVAGVEGEAEAWLVTFKPSVETKVLRGENAGVSYEDAHVVTNARRLGAVSGAANLEAPAPGGGDRCALLVQAPGEGPILAAAYCAEN